MFKKKKKLSPEQEKKIKEALSSPEVVTMLKNINKYFPDIEEMYKLNEKPVKKNYFKLVLTWIKGKIWKKK